MSGIVILIVIIVFISKARKASEAIKKQNTQQQRPSSSQQILEQRRQVEQRTKSASGKNVTTVSSTKSQPSQSKNVQTKTLQVQQPKGRKEPMSTTEMLEAKAKAENREEMLEKQRQKKENMKHYGHHNYAQRYMIGDPIPASRKMIYCSYCNAENLIPRGDSPRKYNCYFCREELK